MYNEVDNNDYYIPPDDDRSEEELALDAEYAEYYANKREDEKRQRDIDNCALTKKLAI
jgi:hypothetical protein